MAKVLFIQNIPFEFMGPMYISAMLKENGHDCRLLITKDNKNYLSELMDYNPDIVAFSVMTGPHLAAIETAHAIKQNINAMVVFGGPHPTFFPDVIKESCVDIVCIGEGEEAMVELTDNLDRGKDISSIRNMWIKKGDEIVKNSPRPLISDLDHLPFPDRSLYDQCSVLRSLKFIRVLTGRGCPFNCSFCFNHALKEIYNDSGGSYVRKRSPQNIIDEIKESLKRQEIKLVRFPDDTFIGKRSWTKTFLVLYREQVGLPFTCLVHPVELTEGIVADLKISGCINMFFGVESGSDDIRNNILKKGVKTEKLFKVAKWCRKHKLKFGTYSMYGLPTETVEDAIQTVKINAEMRPTYVMSTVFQPYPGTGIANFSIEKNLLDNNMGFKHLQQDGSILKSENIDRLINIHRLSFYGVKFPFLIPVIKQLSKLPQNRIFRMLYDLSVIPVMRKSLNLNWIEMLKLSYSLRNEL